MEKRSDFDMTLARLMALHGQEVDSLHQENQSLKRHISLLQSNLRECMEKLPADEPSDEEAGQEVFPVREFAAETQHLAMPNLGILPAVYDACMSTHLQRPKTRKRPKRTTTPEPSLMKTVLTDADAQKALSSFVKDKGSLTQKCRHVGLKTIYCKTFSPPKSDAGRIFQIKHKLRMLLQRPAFNLVFAGVIFFNTVLLGIEVDWKVVHGEQKNPVLYWVLEACNYFFVVELALRIFLDGCHWFFILSEHRLWNILDFILVVLSMIEPILELLGGANAKLPLTSSIAKTCRMLRVMRIFHVFRFFREMNDLVLMVADAGRSLVSALLILTVILFVNACCITSRSIEWLVPGRPDDEKLARYFSSMSRTIYTLVKTTLGGVSWGEVSDELLKVDPISFVLFGIYVVFTILAVLNIITGVFVENAVELRRTQRDFQVMKEMELKENLVRELSDIFAKIDHDHSGRLTAEEMATFADEPGVSSYFQTLGLEITDVEKLFALIDVDGSGDISPTEFINGCMKLKGEARSIDIFHLKLICQRLEGIVLDVLKRPCAGQISKGRPPEVPTAEASIAPGKWAVDVTAEGEIDEIYAL